MKHLDDGTLRRFVDDPGSAGREVAEHLGTCSDCQARRDAVASDAAFVAERLRGEPARIDVDAAFGRLAGTVASQPANTTFGDRVADLMAWDRRRVVLPVAYAVAAVAAIILLAFTPI
ncbi:MAG TPA: hypothetical protein VFF43_03450, partial [Caldimonas sp.]|nr:hypothetical protein [Caldimonas sp.]